MASQAIGIDIGSHAVKIAVLQKKGAVTRATRLFRAKLAGDEDPLRIQGALARAGVSGGPALLGVSGRDLIIRYTHVPPVPDWRLKLLMQFEINEVSGQSGGEVAADYSRLQIPSESSEETILVALARNSWLHPRLEWARSAGMRAAGGCPNSVAIFNAFLSHGSWEEGETVYVVNVGRENLDMAICRDGELFFARNLSGGGSLFTEAIMSTFGLKEGKAERNKTTKGDLTPKGKASYPDSTSEKLANAMLGPAGQLVSMIQSTVMIARAQTKMPDLKVDRLVLTGGTARMKGIADYFAENMSIRTEVFDPVGELDLQNLHPEDAEELGDDPLDFAAAVGLAETLLHPQALRLEVLTEKEKKKRHFVQRTAWELAAAALGLVLLVLLFQNRSQRIDRLEAANEKLTVQQQRFKTQMEQGNAAMAKERDARKKEVALRSRTWAGGLFRAATAAIYASHRDALYLEGMRMDVSKRALDLQARPGKSAAAGGDSEKNLLQQIVWPELEVQGRVQEERTQDPAGDLADYYRAIQDRLDDVVIDGLFRIDFNRESLDKQNRFRMKFTLEPLPRPGEEG